MYYDRKQKKVVEEIEYQKGTLEYLYNTKSGRLLLKAFVARPWISKLNGLYQKSFLSKRKIKTFAEKYRIGLSKDELRKYRSFNDFFIRKHKPVKRKNKNELVAIADSKLSIYDITDDLRLKIKNTTYSTEEILENRKIASFFEGGKCLVFRLAVSDNHHYNYIDDGKLAFHKKIKGVLHTIRPISEKYRVFCRNSREVSLLNTKNLGYVAQIEIGATLVGKIKNNGKQSFKKNDEKGYFEFGGSTIVVLLNKDIQFDEDIVQANSDGIETQVFAGEKIGLLLDNTCKNNGGIRNA